MRFTEGSVLSFTPHHGWLAVFKADDGEEWTEPVIGWATVVTWSGAEQRLGGTVADEHTTRIEAVVLDGSLLTTTSDYVQSRDGTKLWQLLGVGG